jgi:hypothetical protein
MLRTKPNLRSIFEAVKSCCAELSPAFLLCRRHKPEVLAGTDRHL